MPDNYSVASLELRSREGSVIGSNLRGGAPKRSVLGPTEASRHSSMANHSFGAGYLDEDIVVDMKVGHLKRFLLLVIKVMGLLLNRLPSVVDGARPRQGYRGRNKGWDFSALKEQLQSEGLYSALAYGGRQDEREEGEGEDGQDRGPLGEDEPSTDANEVPGIDARQLQQENDESGSEFPTPKTRLEPPDDQHWKEKNLDPVGAQDPGK